MASALLLSGMGKEWARASAWDWGQDQACHCIRKGRLGRATIDSLWHTWRTLHLLRRCSIQVPLCNQLFEVVAMAISSGLLWVPVMVLLWQLAILYLVALWDSLLAPRRG
jgi:hypothetical protein